MHLMVYLLSLLTPVTAQAVAHHGNLATAIGAPLRLLPPPPLLAGDPRSNLGRASA